MIHQVWLSVDAGGYVVMRASENPRDRYFESIDIYNANSPAAVKLYNRFREGKTITRQSALKIKSETERENLKRPWKVVDMHIAPNDQGASVLWATLESSGMRVATAMWPPRSPSARLYLEAFKFGNILYDKDLRTLKTLIKAEADMVGLIPNQPRGVLEWNPDWNEYL